MKNLKLMCCALGLAALAGCTGTAPLSKNLEADTKATRDKMDFLIKEQESQKKEGGLTVQDWPEISIKPLSTAQQNAKEMEWLTSIHITIDPAKNASIPASSIIRMFRDKGINIVTSLPLDLYSYNGFGVTDVNAETALLVFMGAMGLDYDIDNKRQLVTIEPMKSQSWTLNIGNRRTAFNTADGTSGNSSSSSSSPTGSSASGQVAGVGTYPGANPAMGPSGSPTSSPSSTSSSQSASTSSSGNSITTSDDVWGKLASELAQRVSVLVPKVSNTNEPATPNNGGAMPTPIPPSYGQPNNGSNIGNAGGQMAAGNSMYVRQNVGQFTINPETGEITVQAPKYIIKSLDKYLTEVQEMYNTTITFEGEIVTVTTDKNISEGIDWSAFNTFAGGSMTSIVQNSILGGAVLSSAAGTTSLVNSVTVGNQSIPGATSLFGVASKTQKFAAFNAFLSSIGQLKIKDTPRVITTSGAPVNFKNTITKHYQLFQQNAASGGVGSAAVATNTILVAYDTGMTLRLNPRYDVHTGLVRTQFSLDRTLVNGYETQVNPVSTGTGTGIQLINTLTPILANTLNNGELLLKNNDLVVVGGLTEDTENNSDSGTTGLMDTPLKNLTGQGSRNKSTTTYYFALRVLVAKKD
jgi:type II secretory pathway component GspD/PulD (secretin)